MVIIRELLVDFNYNLKFSEAGIKFQVATRTKILIYKILKYVLSYISGLCCISADVCVEEKLKKLHFEYFDEGFKHYVGTLLEAASFRREVLSITYKTVLSTGLFNSYTELNTMNEGKFELYLKKVFTNDMNAPFGSQHHASFTLGNYRYQFLYVQGDVSRQKITTSSEIKRSFNLKNREF
mmetsp:Transcript_6255/g.5684  ORF Transcript_6255/g.5684 Transcript_6255/m.5684 type:complete len:181 (-) Transcript_6255:64-606(-)